MREGVETPAAFYFSNRRTPAQSFLSMSLSAEETEISHHPSGDFRGRVAVVHDWLPLYGGAERVLEQILNLFPQADIFSIIDAIPAGARDFLQNKPVCTSFIQHLPGATRHYRNYLPLMPLAIEQFDLRGYDLVISSSYAVAKGILTGPDQLHICYCSSPIRYAWDLQSQYLHESGLTKGVRSWLVRALLHYIRIWDSRTAAGVDYFVANSKFVARRIQKVYRRDSTVIHPPVDVDAFPLQAAKEDFYLTASRLVPYKRVDLIVDAFSKMSDRRLIVIGDGPDFRKIQKRAGANVEMLGFQDGPVLRDYLQRAKAFIFAAEEDFGIVPLEAQACGTPVIAFGKGGALETVIEGCSGVFFAEQTVASLFEAVQTFEVQKVAWAAPAIRKHAESFSSARFRQEFQDFVSKKCQLYFNPTVERARRP